MRKILIATIVFLSFFSSSLLASAAPTYDITISPSSPAPESTIIVTANISGGTFSNVYLTLQECKDTFCYGDGWFNVTIDKVSASRYEKEITLKHSDANNIEYWLVIEDSDGKWYDFWDEYEQKDLKTTSGTGGNTDPKKTPGFELVVFVISVALLLFIIRQKRAK